MRGETIGEIPALLGAIDLSALVVYVSSSSELVAHPAFREIGGMRARVVPLLLR